MKKILVLFILVVLITVFSVGCAANVPADDILLEQPIAEPLEQIPEVLYLVTENYLDENSEEEQLEALIDSFNESHNTQIERIELPGKPDARESALQNMKADIAAGHGPDIFLLPTEKTLDSVGLEILEPLFPDLNLAMRNGAFADLSALYEQDAFMSEDLHADGLNQLVLDAGMVNGFRYLLPLQYDYPVAYVNSGVPELAGLESLDEILDACRLSDQENIISLSWQEMDWFLLNPLPDLVDYESFRVGVSADELADYLQSYSRWLGDSAAQRTGLGGGDIFDCTVETYWANNGGWIRFGSLDDAVREAAMAAVMDVDLKMLPITSQDGRVTAKVTYYGAVSANCQAPDLAYEFLRQFLLEQHQWETADYALRTIEDSNRYGWPVRTLGAVTHGFDMVKEKFDTFNRDDEEFLAAITNLHLTDTDVPILEVPLDGAYFPPSTLEYELKRQVDALYREEADSNAYLELAKDFIAKLEKSMMEG